jgi:hypothetical protein
MRAQTFHASYGKFDFEASCDFHYSSCMKRLRECQVLDSREPTCLVYTRLHKLDNHWPLSGYNSGVVKSAGHRKWGLERILCNKELHSSSSTVVVISTVTTDRTGCPGFRFCFYSTKVWFKVLRAVKTTILVLTSTLKMEAVCPSEMLVSAYSFTRRYNQEVQHQYTNGRIT